VKPFLFSFRWTRSDDPICYKLVYADSEEEAKKKLIKWVGSHKYGDMGARETALDVHCETIL